MNRSLSYQEREDNYFVYLKSEKWTFPYCLDSLSQDEIENLSECYLEGKNKTSIRGQTIEVQKITTFRVFKLNSTATPQSLSGKFNRSIQGVFTLQLSVDYFTKNSLTFQEVTKQFIGNKLWGEDSKRKRGQKNSPFIDTSRIKEIKATKIEGFDLSKLIRLCEEVNSSYSAGNFFAVGMLSRALKDHVPPIFGYNNINEILQDGNISKSDRDSLKILHDNKHIQDGFLHSHIKKKETLATASSVEYRPQIDVLLRMIIEKGE